MTTTNDLPARLREHAAIMAAVYEPRHMVWADDMREAAERLERISDRPDIAAKLGRENGAERLCRIL